MHFLPDLLNANKMFLNLATLHPNPNSSVGITNKIERFLYRASCTLQSIISIRSAQMKSVELAHLYVNQLKFDEKDRISLSCSELFLAYSQIPAALSSLVIMQNQLLRLISAIVDEGQDIPKSLNDVMKKGIEKFGFSETINDIMNNYWENNGKYIRETRNINEHFDSLVDYTFFQYKNRIGQVLIFFPDNPDTKSPKNFTYHHENNAIEILYNGITAINDVFTLICESKDIKAGRFQPALIMNYVSDINKDAEKTLGLMISVVKEVGNNKELHTMEYRHLGLNDKGSANLSFKNIFTDHENEKMNTKIS